MRTPTSWVGVNTALPNALVYEAWQTRLIPAWHEFTDAIREHKISKETRLDLLLSAGDRKHYVEVKNVTLADGPVALFPDAETTRGQKHLKELIALREQGFGAEIVFVVQRTDCTHFAPADQIDPEYGRLLREAFAAGVLINAYACEIDPTAGVSLNPKPLELRL